ncbi:YcxB family protein [Clostridium felsineum]|uniref:YcxB family protein n=1 Tax=Clostridium felsineum TaxID=36839 RepID=UPI00098CE6E2|nr:YcxB family protein [Clostridium felsineum]URZ01248.1 hypothetical protein CLAUR_012370 [Clostridium felsineum]
MEINYQISREELVNFHTNHITETKNYKYAIIGNTFFLFLLVFFVLIVSKNSLYTLSTIVMCLIFLVFRKKYMLHRIKKRLLKIFSFEKYNNYFQPTILVVIEDGLNLSTNLSQRIYKWASLNKIYLIDNYIFIQTNSHDDLLIPTNAFKDSKDKEFFINIITQNTNLEIRNKYPIEFKYQ